MATPKPSNPASHPQGNQWFLVRWDAVSKADAYESQHEGESHINRLRHPESAMLAIPYGTTRYTKIRNVVNDEPSGWVTVTLNDRGEIIDIDGGDDTPPNPPSGLRLVSVNLAEGTAEIEWNTQTDADYWEVFLENVFGGYRKASAAAYSFYDLTEGEEYSYRVRAVRKAGNKVLRSAPVRDHFTFRDDPPPPPPPPPGPPERPVGLTAHCITHSSAKAEWQPQDDNDGWEIWLDQDRDQSFVTTKTLVALRDLEPETTYQVNVLAFSGEPGTPGYVESEVATEHFTTLAHEEKPPPPPPPINGDLPAPKHLVVRADSASSVSASWEDARPDTKDDKFFYVTINGRDWVRVDGAEARFTGLSGGREYTVTVFGVFGAKLTSIAQAATTVRRSN